MRDVTLDGVLHARVFGGSVAAPIWKEIMHVALEGLPTVAIGTGVTQRTEAGS